MTKRCHRGVLLLADSARFDFIVVLSVALALLRE